MDGVYNAVQIEGDLTGTVLFQGRGAGAEPTSSAVVADLLDLAHSIVLGTRERKYWGPEGEIPVSTVETLETRYYLRVTVTDQPGVLAQIAQLLGDNGVSIAAVTQKKPTPTSRQPNCGSTHRAREGAMQAALERIRSLAVVTSERVPADRGLR